MEGMMFAGIMVALDGRYILRLTGVMRVSHLWNARVFRRLCLEATNT